MFQPAPFRRGITRPRPGPQAHGPAPFSSRALLCAGEFRSIGRLIARVASRRHRCKRRLETSAAMLDSLGARARQRLSVIVRFSTPRTSLGVPCTHRSTERGLGANVHRIFGARVTVRESTFRQLSDNFWTTSELTRIVGGYFPGRAACNFRVIVFSQP